MPLEFVFQQSHVTSFGGMSVEPQRCGFRCFDLDPRVRAKSVFVIHANRQTRLIPLATLHSHLGEQQGSQVVAVFLDGGELPRTALPGAGPKPGTP